MPDSALIQLYWANQMYTGSCDSLMLMALYANLTSVYLSLNELTRIDSVSRIAMDLWNPDWKDKELRFAIFNNLAIAQVQRGEAELATSTFRQAYLEAKRDGDQKNIQIGLNNLGSIKGMVGDLDSAYYFLNEGAIHAQQHKDMDNLMSLLINLANLDRERGRLDRAIILLDSAYYLADTLNSLEKMALVQHARATIFAGKGSYKQAYEFLGDYISIHEKYLNEERVKAVTEMIEKYESEKKARQIQQLELDKLDATLTNERVTNARNRYLFGGVGVLLIALGLMSRLQYVRKSRAAIQKEKDVSEGLLLNILPASVADELKIKGHADARQFPSITILFSDFKEFTSIAGQLSPADLVEEINVCFSTFDEIMTRFGLEKIKTIGDAYMAAAAIPDTNTATTIDVINAALDMQDFITKRKIDRDRLQLPAFEMRIGIHSGPVVAGIVGIKKFQYDIWGDTVNVASRMETNGEPGRVNISDVTYQLIKTDHSLTFTSRGMIQAKGKGEMAMYFVDRAT
jgi:class 3 adenylate cyclase